MYVLLDVSVYLCYLRRLIKPVVTAKALLHVWLSGFNFEDVWKTSILTEDVYPRPVRYNIFYMGVRVGFQSFKQSYFSLFEFQATKTLLVCSILSLFLRKEALN